MNFDLWYFLSKDDAKDSGTDIPLAKDTPVIMYILYGGTSWMRTGNAESAITNSVASEAFLKPL